VFVALSLLVAIAIMAPVADAQAPAAPAAPVPKVNITGFIDTVTSYTRNASNFDGILNRQDKQFYARNRGRFDIVGEVGSAKAVFGFEIDAVWGQTGSNDSSIVNAGPAATTAVAIQPGTSAGFDLNTDVRGILEVKWLYVEFPAPLIPVPMIVRLGAQPFATAASYKLATYANGDFPGVNLYTTITPGFKLQTTYVQVEERLVGTETKTGLAGPLGLSNTQNRGDDYAAIVSPEFTPFKGLDIKPMLSKFYAQGTTSTSARAGRGGINTSTFFTNPDGSSHGDVNENRYTVGVDARYRMGPFSFDPSIYYQFGSRTVIGPTAAQTGGPQFISSGAVPGRKYYSNINAWLIDVRGGFQLGPLLLQGLGVYSSGNTARNNTFGTVRFFQPLDTDTSYLADWGTQITSLGLDYSNSPGSGAVRMAYPGNQIGWDKYGRIQVGAKATYALTPSLSVMAGVNGHWTAEGMDRNGTAIAGAGILPVFAGPRPRSTRSYVGTEFMSEVTWNFAPGISWGNAAGYMISGPALDAVTDPTAGAQNAKDVFIYTSRVRFSF
jgi:hypothetical protein